ncbi:hypothetical protein ILYODFUR_035158 [Ilyodon furcidens]|uniref:Uncharacterized protein n=1 Tax=Ilyodon furcidens TaxID=33524 RepID=A0ABV0TDR2_9TELE
MIHSTLQKFKKIYETEEIWRFSVSFSSTFVCTHLAKKADYDSDSKMELFLQYLIISIMPTKTKPKFQLNKYSTPQHGDATTMFYYCWLPNSFPDRFPSCLFLAA